MIDGSLRSPKQTRVSVCLVCVQSVSGLRPVCVHCQAANVCCVLAMCSFCVHVAFTQSEVGVHSVFSVRSLCIHSKLDYCNSLYLNISNQQLNRLQLILNSAARAVTKTPKFHHITPHLKSLHWLKITQRIQYKILSLTYKSLQYNKPSSISDLLTIQPTRSTRSSAVVTLQRPSNPSRLKISDRSFYFQAPALWNALPHHLRSHSHSSQSHSLLSLSSSQFHKQLKTHLFLHSYPP